MDNKEGPTYWRPTIHKDKIHDYTVCHNYSSHALHIQKKCCPVDGMCEKHKKSYEEDLGILIMRLMAITPKEEVSNDKKNIH